MGAEISAVVVSPAKRRAEVTGEWPVELFVPAETVARSTGGPLPVPPLPELLSVPLVLGMAAMDHSGRIRDRLVLSALGWGPDDLTRVSVRARALVLRRVDRGGVPIDARGRVFLSVGARTQLEIGIDDRLLLVANPQRALLIVHPVRVIAALLADFYTRGPGALDDDT